MIGGFAVQVVIRSRPAFQFPVTLLQRLQDLEDVVQPGHPEIQQFHTLRCKSVDLVRRASSRIVQRTLGRSRSLEQAQEFFKPVRKNFIVFHAYPPRPAAVGRSSGNPCVSGCWYTRFAYASTISGRHRESIRVQISANDVWFEGWLGHIKNWTSTVLVFRVRLSLANLDLKPCRTGHRRAVRDPEAEK